MIFEFDEWEPVLPEVDLVWRTRSEAAGDFVSVATTHWEIVVMTRAGRSTVFAHGPETRATIADVPPDTQFFGISFALGVHVPGLPLRAILDREDQALSDAGSRTFWLKSAAWEVPTFHNADAFVERLVRSEMLVRDPIVDAVMRGERVDASARTVQNRFRLATGVTYKTIQQIERARQAASFLEDGTSIADTAFELGYYDQAHLTNSLRRFMGVTPGRVQAES